MDFVYTYYSFGGSSNPSLFFLKMARLSVHSLRSVKKLNDKIVLYTDKQSLCYFNSLPFDDMVVVDYSKLNIDNRYWNFAKIMTYAQMEGPFLHVDFDTMFMPGFHVPFDDVVTEKRRSYKSGLRLRTHSWRNLKKPQKLVCSGLIGSTSGKAIPLFQQNAKKAISSCNALFVGDNERISIEEYAFSQLVESQELNVSELDNRYFAHWQGANKEEKYGTIINKLYNQFF